MGRSGGMSRHRRTVTFVLALLLVWIAACSEGSPTAGGAGGGEDASGEPSGQEPPAEGASAPLRSAQDAPAAAGSGLPEPPGPSERVPLEGFGEVAIAVVAADGTVSGWCALLAETADQRSQGLMGVTDLGGYKGMLFVADQQHEQKFWMANTPMPLSIAWFDDEGRFVSAADMEPFDEVCEQCRSDGPARFALEVPQGELAGMGIDEGSALRVGGACAG